MGAEKSPLPSRRAASRKPLSRPCKAREATIEKPNASARKAPISTAATARLPPSEAAVADRAESTVTVTRAPPKPVNVWLTARYPLPLTVTSPSAGAGDRLGTAIVEARIFGPSRTTTATPAVASSRAYSEAVSSDAVTIIARPPPRDLRIAEPGAIALRSPTSTIVLDPFISVALASPACLASDARWTDSALPFSDPTARPSVTASLRADAASLA